MDKIKEIAMYALGAVIVIGFFTLLGLLATRGIPANNAELLHLSIGALIGSFGTVVTYFYGSSLGSKEKTKILGDK